ncbi:unnamed protein product [Spirodela intermedia]|uniref:Uncharacterized protein n=1 Tax=Spirodela intermedia TaxID=51605 RepID=A0A7I8II13_SPIIN|nr:unnamed protein product [Spirodela intermedia]CAA6656512.1 unnamed protein product [Spirodela intermedia]
MEGMRFLVLVSYSKVRRQRADAALAREEETAAVYRHPSSRSSSTSGMNEEETSKISLLGGRNGGGALLDQKVIISSRSLFPSLRNSSLNGLPDFRSMDHEILSRTIKARRRRCWRSSLAS